MENLVTRQEAMAILGINSPSNFTYHILKAGIEPAKKEDRNGRLFYLYSRPEIENLKKEREKDEEKEKNWQAKGQQEQAENS